MLIENYCIVSLNQQQSDRLASLQDRLAVLKALGKSPSLAQVFLTVKRCDRAGKHLLTFNIEDFTRFSEIVATPQTI